jgi:hypothetical protein
MLHAREFCLPIVRPKPSKPRVRCLIIPSAVDPTRQGAGQADPVKVQRPAGRTILTGSAWSAGLVPWSMADGMIRPRLGQQHTVDGVVAIIPEPECPTGGSGFTENQRFCVTEGCDLRRNNSRVAEQQRVFRQGCVVALRSHCIISRCGPEC